MNSGYHRHLTKTDVLYTKCGRFIFVNKWLHSGSEFPHFATGR